MRGRPANEPWSARPGEAKLSRECPACHQPKHSANFVGELCGSCFAEGKPFPDQQKDQEEEPMTKAGERSECPWCHKMRANLTEHRKFCKDRPAGPEGDTQPKPRGRRPKKARTGDGRVAAPLLPGVFGILAGRDAALAQDLVAEAVRGGMPLGAACALIGRALSVPR